MKKVVKNEHKIDSSQPETPAGKRPAVMENQDAKMENLGALQQQQHNSSSSGSDSSSSDSDSDSSSSENEDDDGPAILAMQ